ncbi:G-protein coupled receptor 87-like [Coregonus clupeaformis]|uniref:G-protein coupled receptor 87-like n=1 Tax=Coregonus clupeaformis TaxID=59861 RepID=UPI001E1C7651|nr:G-protein coupled receptor 87-like [Coregonus clupeaformis]
MAISSLYFLLFIPALIINGVAVLVCMQLRSTSTFMVYLKNLVVTDLLMTLSIPLKAANILPSAPLTLKAFTCRYSDVIFYLCMYMSIILLGLISLDRFFKIVRPCGRLLGQNLVFGKVLSASIWVVLLATNVIPTMILTNQVPTNKTKEYCMKMKSDAGQAFHRDVVLFNSAIFWMVTSTTSCTKATLRISKKITLWMSAMNVCLDPLIYFFLCKSFRTNLFKMFRLPPGTCSWLTGKGSSPNTTEDQTPTQETPQGDSCACIEN